MELTKCHLTHALSRDKKYLLRLKQEELFLCRVRALSTGCVGTLSPGRKCSRSKAHSYVAEWGAGSGAEDCEQETAFPNIHKMKTT